VTRFRDQIYSIRFLVCKCVECSLTTPALRGASKAKAPAEPTCAVYFDQTKLILIHHWLMTDRQRVFFVSHLHSPPQRDQSKGFLVPLRKPVVRGGPAPAPAPAWSSRAHAHAHLSNASPLRKCGRSQSRRWLTRRPVGWCLVVVVRREAKVQSPTP
jgi:hypothetical protein